jgi:IS5 family transposase
LDLSHRAKTRAETAFYLCSGAPVVFCDIRLQKRLEKGSGPVQRFHQRASRNHPLSKAQENANRKKSKSRARVEHVFGAQQTSPGGRIIRTIGIARAKAKIGLQNLAYNIRRLVTLERMAAV